MITLATYRKHYDSTHARNLYFKEHEILNKAGTKDTAKWFCQNPDCNKIVSLQKLKLHHLLPRRIAPSLTYEVSNLILLCEECHHEIEHNFPKKKKVPFPIPDPVFCHYCGYQIFYKRDRIGKLRFHPKCTPKYINEREI